MILIALASMVQSNVVFSQCHPDYGALEALYISTNGGSWNNNTGWLTDCDPCNWFGVSCTNGRVSRLNLANNHLDGPLPDEIGELTELTNLEYHNNSVSGPIPESIGDLSKLTWWVGQQNDHTGSIPTTVSQLDNLTRMVLGSNQIDGSIPAAIGDMVKLSELNLEYNNLSGPIPVEMCSAPELSSITIGVNQLTGSIPVEIGNLAKLRYMRYPNNEISGYLPATIGNCIELREWIGSRNQHTGEIPPEFGNLSQLRQLRLNSNQLAGAIPAELGNLGNLWELVIEYNNLSGIIPVELYNATGLTYVTINNNQIEGPIDPAIGNLTALQILYTSSNSLSGPIPSTIGDCVSLREWIGGQNNLTGQIPSEMGNLTELRRLYLNHNELSGELPVELSYLSNLSQLILTSNELSGSIPHELSNLSNLGYLQLGYNNFEGQIPEELTSLSKLVDCQFLVNDLSGPVPDFSEVPNLIYFLINSNQFTFEGMEENVSIPVYRYQAQSRLPVHHDGGQLFVEAGGTESNNTYKWYDVTFGLVETVVGNKYFTPPATGNYFVYVTNSLLPDLTLPSDTAEVICSQEICDGIDNNCDGLVDDDDPTIIGQPTWYQDSDGDGFGDPEFFLMACNQPEGFVPTGTDCNDLNPLIFPEAEELLDELDNDCDGEVDEGLISMSVDIGECTTTYFGYGPMECSDIDVQILDGTPPYTYAWSTGESGAMITVCPDQTTIYGLTVTDAQGHTALDEISVHVIDVRCGNNNNKVLVCHYPPGNPDNAQNICISVNAVQTHLSNHGDGLGLCGLPDPCNGEGEGMLMYQGIPVIHENHSESLVEHMEEHHDSGLDISVFPNPTKGEVFVEFRHAPELGEIKVLDVLGRVIDFQDVRNTRKVRLDLSRLTGGQLCVLVVEVDGLERKAYRLVVTE